MCCQATMKKHYRLAALLHDVFRKPHRQKVYLKPKYKAKTSRFLSTLRFLFGVLEGTLPQCGNTCLTTQMLSAFRYPSAHQKAKKQPPAVFFTFCPLRVRRGIQRSLFVVIKCCLTLFKTEVNGCI